MKEPKSPYDTPLADLSTENDNFCIDVVMFVIFAILALFIIDNEMKNQNQK